MAIGAFRKFLTCTESELMMERLEKQSVWNLLEKEDTCPHGLLYVAQALAEEHCDHVHSVVDVLSSSLMSVYDPFRITVVAFYSEVHLCTKICMHDRCACLCYQATHSLALV